MYAVVELKYEVGRMLIVPVRNIMNFKPKFNKTDDFLCYWSSDISETTEDMECGYQKTFTGQKAIFKVFVVTLTDSIDEAEKYLAGKRATAVTKRFRDPQNTDEELKRIEAKKKRNAKKATNAFIAKARESNMQFLIDELKQQGTSSKEEGSLEVMEAPIPDVPGVSNSQSNILNSNQIIVVDVDELSKNNKDLIAEVGKLRKENAFLKVDVEQLNKRNRMLQYYLVAVNERVPELLFEEKDGGRLYRGAVFLNKKQCSALDKSLGDREYLNNLLMAVYGRDVLSTHSLTGLPSNNTKGPPKLKLEPTRLQLIYDIMEARSVAKKTKKMTKAEINEVIGKKCSNVSAYDTKNAKKL